MNAAEHMVRMRRLAEEAGSILVAPYFSKANYPRYQQLQDPKTKTRADLALIDIVEHVAQEFELVTRKFVMIGFSGGAQFAHRFAFYHADRVSHCISCAAGWYTYPDFDEAYPFGLRDGTGPANLSVHPEWSKVVHHVIVGKKDNSVEPSLNMKKAVVTRQGIGRLERARRWVAAMNNIAIDHCCERVKLTQIPGLGHDYADAHDRFRIDRFIASALA